MPLSRKVLVYVLRDAPGGPELLVFDSHEEPGCEVPRGKAQIGESIVDAAHRELREESGLSASILEILGSVVWKNERQSFVLAAVHGEPLDEFSHVVTGGDEDDGLTYAFHWLPVDRSLSEILVQGCDALVPQLLVAIVRRG